MVIVCVVQRRPAVPVHKIVVVCVCARAECVQRVMNAVAMERALHYVMETIVMTSVSLVRRAHNAVLMVVVRRNVLIAVARANAPALNPVRTVPTIVVEPVSATAAPALQDKCVVVMVPVPPVVKATAVLIQAYHVPMV